MTSVLPPDPPARVAVFGLGYVGTVTAACLADLGHTVVGVDIAEAKVEAVNAGAAPVVERGLNELIRSAVDAGRLSATTDGAEAVRRSDLAFVCVGTPSRPSGDHDVSFLGRVAAEIGAALRGRKDYFGLVIRSTVLPGTTEAVVAPVLAEASGLDAGRDFGVAHNPEFMREGTAVEDFRHPPFTVVGTADERLREMLRKLYRRIDAPFLATDLRVAETLKLVSNAFHAVKVVFANEVGTVCKALGVDAREVMDLFVQDTKLNISPKYLRPGFAFGGSCLPKDVRALTSLGRQHHSEIPLLDAIVRSNELHIRRAVQMVEQGGRKTVGLLGLVFKPGTDDLRESPVVELAQTLLGRGFDLRIYDPYLNMARLSGANRRFIDRQIPHLTRLLAASADAVVQASEVVVVGYDAPEFRTALAAANGNHRIIDLAGVPGDGRAAAYEGIGW